MKIDALCEYYNGFYIDAPVGNNAFSFDQRIQKRIFVPPLCKGSLSDLDIGEKIVFSELEDGQEINCAGLEKFVYLQMDGRHIFIFDNHNHAFFFWMAALIDGKIRPGMRLVHVDQHTDMRKPASWYQEDTSLKSAFHYTTRVLNVGNFIQPALQMGMFEGIDIIDSSTSFESTYDREIVLDIDIDVFSPDMAYIESDYKLSRIREWIQYAQFITIATSPFFIDQADAISRIKELLE